MQLKQIAVINAGYPFRSKVPEHPDSSIVAVQMKDISLSEGIRWSECTPTELTGKREPNYLAVNDILIAARGNHNYAALVDDGLAATGKQAVAAPHFFVVTLKRRDILPEFMIWLLNQAPAQRYFEQNAEGTLTKSIRRNVLEQTPVVVPPQDKQRAIVAMASSLRQEQRLAQQLIQNGERMMNIIVNNLLDQEIKP